MSCSLVFCSASFTGILGDARKHIHFPIGLGKHQCFFFFTSHCMLPGPNSPIPPCSAMRFILSVCLWLVFLFVLFVQFVLFLLCSILTKDNGVVRDFFFVWTSTVPDLKPCVSLNNPRSHSEGVFKLALQPPDVAGGNLSSGFKNAEIRPSLFPHPSGNQVKPSLSSPFSFSSLFFFLPLIGLFTFLMVLYFQVALRAQIKQH